MDIWTAVRKIKYNKDTIHAIDELFVFNDIPKIFPIIKNFVSNKKMQFKYQVTTDKLDEIFNGQYSHIN